MKILMMTNTYLPHVGGVARSVEAFSRAYREAGHEVLVIAPEFADAADDEPYVVRVPAVQNFNGTDFSVRLPIPGFLNQELKEFEPDIIHAHHPFLLGDTALRVSARLNRPLVFTHHTMYERYTHYVPGDSPALQRFVMDLATHYANLCDQIIAPSESIAALLRHRGVEAPIESIPTGVDVDVFASGDGAAVRREFQIPDGAFVVGHLGRLAPEKNLPFLAQAVCRFLKRRHNAHFLVVGSGPSEKLIRDLCQRRDVADRVHLAGVRKGQALVDAYHAMNVFAFASTSETQGMVLTEAMAAGLPVVAVDAPGVREVVRDRHNGRLLASQQQERFAQALQWVADQKDSERLQTAARETADRFSMSRCAQRALDVYQSLLDRTSLLEHGVADESLNPWETTLRMIDTEYQLWSNRTAAISTAIQGNYLSKTPWFRWIRYYLRRLRRALSRNEWATRLLKLPRSEGTAVEPGLIMIQIDGLSHSQFQRALHQGRLPFLKRLIRHDHYQLKKLYSGLPSSTPAVQGELFYGVCGAVPAFHYRDHRTGELMRMFEPRAASHVQSVLAAAGPGLLEHGSAYCDIYSGGAAEPRFCAATLGWDDFWRAANPLSCLLFLLMHLVSSLRIAGLLAVEFVLAWVDFFRGLIHGRDLWKELKFIPTRVGICVLMRELNVIGASIDATRGLPIIHVNFLGYDEQAHRRGPNSSFAHWSLKGIDYAIHRIWDAAHRSHRRDYVVWIYSDHGQEPVIAYSELTGQAIQQAVVKAVDFCQGTQHTAPPDFGDRADVGVELQRGRWLTAGRRSLFAPKLQRGTATAGKNADEVIVTAMGPIGHVYLGRPGETGLVELREAIARRLVEQHDVPAALIDTPDGVVAWTRADRFKLPDDNVSLLGADHPSLSAATADLIALCRHPDAGHIVLSGWRSGVAPLSFATESGAHGGSGPEETHGVALLPAEAAARFEGDTMRPLELRNLALNVVHPSIPKGAGRRVRRWLRESEPEISVGPTRDSLALSSDESPCLRILTYNVHSCIGMDGRLSPRRIARVIARCQPNVVALQEVDVRRRQSLGLDQAQMIARELEMEYHFHVTWQIEEEQYGNVVLSRLPLRLIDELQLPLRGRNREPRGAMIVEITVGQMPVRLVNTHLGLSGTERRHHTQILLDQLILESLRDGHPTLLCGDFNALPRSTPYRMICRHLRDVQVLHDGHRPRPTWSSAYPLGRIDHVFVSDHFAVDAVEVRRSHLARLASDHLPLVVECRLQTPVAGEVEALPELDPGTAVRSS